MIMILILTTIIKITITIINYCIQLTHWDEELVELFWGKKKKKKIEYLKQDYEEKHIQPVSLPFSFCLRSTNNNYDFNIIKTTMEIGINSSYIQCISWMTWPHSIKIISDYNNITCMLCNKIISKHCSILAMKRPWELPIKAGQLTKCCT